jgi:glutamate formiminotransferase
VFQCAPNISEGRDAALLERIKTEMENVPGVALGDISMDPDHNRMVVSLLGSAPGLHQAVLQLFQTADECLDMRLHHGVHPRIGAVDVVPFVPLAGETMEAANRLALQTAEAVAERFNLPVLLYEFSARLPERKALPDLRRGGLVGVQEKLHQTPPDFGPVQLHPKLGATVVGARKPLVAYNIMLKTDNLAVAQDVARRLRLANGGLPGVRALGLLLASRGQVQVSINLISPDETDLHEVFQRVEQLAGEHGVDIDSSELVGMAPASSFVKLARHHLKSPQLLPGQLLEWNCLHQSQALSRGTSS